ncbi:MAG: hypothetical protein Q7V19_06200 [Bacteroidales bacterium]|nr:hypothetical protein [Bacteroidales bacterium]
MEENQKSKSLSKKDWIIALLLLLAIIAVLIFQYLNKANVEVKQTGNLKSVLMPEASISQIKLLCVFNANC